MLEFPAGIRIHGDFSRIEKQKSIAIQIRDNYGRKGVDYPSLREMRLPILKACSCTAAARTEMD